MQIFRDLTEITRDKNTILTLGTFDGLHLGHQKILDELKISASEKNSRSFVLTFDPHPKMVVSNGYDVKLLTGLNEKIEMFEAYGIENLFVINFTREFSQQTSEEFFKKYIINGTGISEVIVGHDHHFGKGRGGDSETLKELGEMNNFKVKVVGAFELNDEVVSSTKIREALFDGNIRKANSMLGRYYSFKGEVVPGDGRGRDLGFPTANIKLKDGNKLLPRLGIYAVLFNINGEDLYGLLSIGKRPTFYNSGEVVPEVYIYNFDKDIYGERVEIKIIEKIRGEEKYNSVEELVEQMHKDKTAGLEIFNGLNNRAVNMERVSN